jgi:hypothetical protein
VEVKDVKLVSLLSTGGQSGADEPCKAFLSALTSCCRLPHVVLADGRASLPSFAEPLDEPVVLLNADRVEVMAALVELPLAAAVERYALFAWWKYHRQHSRGFWLHGHRRVVERMGESVVVSSLYTTESLCAFGSESMGLPELLARYLELAAART